MNPEPEVRLNLWRIAGLFGEHPNAQKRCETICYEPDRETGRHLVRVRFVYQRDLFEPEEALLSQHLLFPEPHGPLQTTEPQVVGRRRHTAPMGES